MFVILTVRNTFWKPANVSDSKLILICYSVVNSGLLFIGFLQSWQIIIKVNLTVLKLIVKKIHNKILRKLYKLSKPRKEFIIIGWFIIKQNFWCETLSTWICVSSKFFWLCWNFAFQKLKLQRTTSTYKYKMFAKAFINCHFSYCALMWKLHERASNCCRINSVTWFYLQNRVCWSDISLNEKDSSSNKTICHNRRLRICPCNITRLNGWSFRNKPNLLLF